MATPEQRDAAGEWLRQAALREQRAVTIDGGRRCAVRQSEAIEGWWVGTSPRNGDLASVEGPWGDWVALAHGILAYDAAIKAGTAHEAITPWEVPDA